MKKLTFVFIAISIALANAQINFKAFEAPYQNAVKSVPAYDSARYRGLSRYIFSTNSFYNSSDKPEPGSCEALLEQLITIPKATTVYGAKIDAIEILRSSPEIETTLKTDFKISYYVNGQQRSIILFNITQKDQKKTQHTLFFIKKDGVWSFGVPQLGDQKIYFVFSSLKPDTFYAFPDRTQKTPFKELTALGYNEETGYNIDALYAELKRLKKEDPKAYAILCHQ